MYELINNEMPIKTMIYEIRGKRIILDNDVAKLFQYETKMLNRQVLRNIERFPQSYCFQLTTQEYESLRCQNGTLKNKRGQHRKYLPYAFTEYGVTMLAGILKSKIAIDASIKIVNTFIEMKNYISDDLLEQKFYQNLVLKHEEELKEINSTLKILKNNDLKEKIFFDGQIYDAYSKILDIMHKSKNELIIIDGYADKNLLDMISHIKSKTIIITKHKSLLKELDIKKYQEQYNNLEIVYNDDFHDRFIIIDKQEVYHLGSSINYAGKKVFAINKLEEQVMINTLLSKINFVTKKNL